MNPKVLIIIPAYNVELNIAGVISSIDHPFEHIVIVNDGSSDDTRKQIIETKVQIINHQENMGMGAALKSGIAYGLSKGFTHAVFMDGDGQHDPAFISVMIKKLGHVDYIFGNRFSATQLSCVPSCKIASNLLGAEVVNACFGTRLQDVSCGFRAIKLQPEQLQLGGNGYDFVFFQLIDTLKRGLNYCSLPIPTIYPVDQLLGTRRSELLSFIKAISPHAAPINWFEDFCINIKLKRDFKVGFERIFFYGYYIPSYDIYIMQTDLSEVYVRYNNQSRDQDFS